MDEFEDLFTGVKPQRQQAARVIKAFGGVQALVSALNFVGYDISRFSIYKWTYMKATSGHGGTGGVIPEGSLPWVKKAARELGIELTNDDWSA